MNAASVRKIGITMGTFALVMAVLLAFAPAPAIAVARHVPADYPTIQAAVNAAAASGDSILVAAGSYAEDVAISGKSLALIAEGPTTTISSCRWTNSSTGAMSRVQGFSIADSLAAISMDGPIAVSSCEIHGSLRLDTTHVVQIGVPLVAVANSSASGTCTVRAIGRFSSVRLTDCDFSAPVSMSSAQSFDAVRRCRFVNADLLLQAEYTATIEDCVFSGSGISGFAGDGCGIERCQISGGAGILLHGSPYGHSIVGNTISNCTTGVAGFGAGSWTITDNAISACGTGISPGGGTPTIARNIISGCDCGIRPGTGSPRILANKVSNCTTGIMVNEGNGNEISNNIVANCSTGVLLDWGAYYVMTGNTIVGCTGDAVRVQSLGVSDARFLSNIVTQSGSGFRFLTVPSVGLTLQCNDVWNNAGGNWIGITDPTGTGGNISVDPLFCDVTTDDYQLDAASPCLAGLHPDGSACGLMGALGPGCGTPVRVTPSTWGRIKAQFR